MPVRYPLVFRLGYKIHICIDIWCMYCISCYFCSFISSFFSLHFLSSLNFCSITQFIRLSIDEVCFHFFLFSFSVFYTYLYYYNFKELRNLWMLSSVSYLFRNLSIYLTITKFWMQNLKLRIKYLGKFGWQI